MHPYDITWRNYTVLPAMFEFPMSLPTLDIIDQIFFSRFIQSGPSCCELLT